ncbi:MAG: thiamine pyrophosphate-binding protein [bacterium]|nr:thiamine pyrophosphate-binding protein [bacterium]
MKLKGSEIVARALEDEGVRYTFGIPGTHNIELYDALERSKVQPVLVTDERNAAFMADAVSRSSDSIGVLNLVPGAGLTHALSGIAEAWMDNVPLVALLCGIRSDTGRAFQLHDVDQRAIVAPVTKDVLRPESPGEIYPVVRRAFALARAGCPGPVAVEIPADFYLLTQTIDSLDEPDGLAPDPRASEADVARAVELLAASKQPLLYLGNGARGAGRQLVELAEALDAPVATTIQGKGVFPESHPLWLWNGLGRSTPKFARQIFDSADMMLAIGCRFSEVATASYGFTPPARMIHVDVESSVLNRNYPAELAVVSDAAAFVGDLLPRIEPRAADTARHERIADGVRSTWAKLTQSSSKRVSPAALFRALQAEAGEDAVFTADSGNGTFLAMEHLRLDTPGRLLAPADFSCMGYAVPAALGAKLADPARDVVALAGDGALLMTGLELMSSKKLEAAPLVCVLRDRELGQIVQFQRTSLNRDTCSVLAPYEVRDYARFVGAEYLSAASDADLPKVVRSGLESCRAGRATVVDVAIDYSRKTFFTKGVVATNLLRLPWSERFRVVGRLIARKFRP